MWHTVSPGGPCLVAGFDDSETSWRALHYALGMAARQRGRLIIVHARPPQLTCWIPEAAIAHQAAHADADRRLRRAVGFLAVEAGVPVVLVTVVGDPVAALVDAARRYQADAIIVGSSRSRWRRLIGSVGLRAVRLRRWPVTVVP